MEVSVGTFNLNNLFSRFNFRAEIEVEPEVTAGGLQLTFGTDGVDVRTFLGNLVREKNAVDRQRVASRITGAMNADILAVQEVEHIEILKEFNRDFLDGMYDHVALIEGNDRRLIDVGILSKLPIGAITSHQTAVHPQDPGRRVFGRDLLEVDILDTDRNFLFKVFNTHMKSHFVPFHEDQVTGKQRANARRKRQAEVTANILNGLQPDTPIILLGDMNDPPDSEFLTPMLSFHNQQLVNALANAEETRPPKPESPGQGDGPQSPVWTHRFNPPGTDTPPEYKLYDQIWLSPSLAPHLSSAHIDRRTRHGGDGSDHDPAWIVLDI